MAVKHFRNTPRPKKAYGEKTHIDISGKFVPPIGTGQVTGSTDVFNGCRVFKLANGVYEVRHDLSGSTFMDFRATAFHSGSVNDFKVFEVLRNASGSQLRIQNSGSLITESTLAPNGVSFVGTLVFGGNG